MRPRRARSGPCTRSRWTTSAPRCGTPRPRSTGSPGPAPGTVGTAGGGLFGAGPPAGRGGTGGYGGYGGLRSSGGRPSGGQRDQGGYGGGEPDPWASSDSAGGGYSDEPPF